MIIGVVSDTHSRPVPKQLVDAFKKVDMIIHAGDFCSLADYQFFTKMKPVQAVFGNVDEPALRKKLPERIIFDIGGVKIGIYHGDGSSQKIIESVSSRFKKEPVDVIIFGHSHEAMNQENEKVLYFNPGSPTDLVIAPYRSYGLLEIDGKNIAGRIVKIKD